MIEVTKTMANGPENRRICDNIVARLLNQGRKPEIKKTRAKNGAYYLRVVDHCVPIYRDQFPRNMIIGFEL